MSNTQKLLDRARDLCSPPTDYQLSKRLEVSNARVSNWRRGIAVPDTEIAWKIAKLLGLPITDVIAYFEADRAKDPKKRAWWEAQLPRIFSAIAIAAALCSSAAGGPLIAERSISPVIYYAKRRLGRSGLATA